MLGRLNPPHRYDSNFLRATTQAKRSIQANTCVVTCLLPPQVTLPGPAMPPGHSPATAGAPPHHHQPAVAYVAQSTPLHGHLTVRETLRYTALLVLGPALGRAAAEQRAEALLHELGLAAAADTFVGTWYLRGISGGWPEGFNLFTWLWCGCGARCCCCCQPSPAD
jgi:hypothetical protein